MVASGPGIWAGRRSSLLPKAAETRPGRDLQADVGRRVGETGSICVSPGRAGGRDWPVQPFRSVTSAGPESRPGQTCLQPQSRPGPASRAEPRLLPAGTGVHVYTSTCPTRVLTPPGPSSALSNRPPSGDRVAPSAVAAASLHRLHRTRLAPRARRPAQRHSSLHQPEATVRMRGPQRAWFGPTGAVGAGAVAWAAGAPRGGPTALGAHRLQAAGQAQPQPLRHFRAGSLFTSDSGA